jgi:hypothetical protein
MAYKICPHCDGWYECLFEGKCPHCDKPIGRKSYTYTKRSNTLRTCPSPTCRKQFKLSKIKNEIRHCPHCDVQIFYPQGRLKGQTLLYSEKLAAAALVELLLSHITERDNHTWRFELKKSETAREIVHAYDIVAQAKKEVKRRGLQIEPEELATLFVSDALANGYAKCDSLLPIRGNISKISNRVCKAQKAKEKVNKTMTQAIDYSAFRVTQ